VSSAPQREMTLDDLWERLWAAGMSDPLIATEQISYFFLLKHLDATQQPLIDGREPLGSAFRDSPNLRWRVLKSLPGEAALAVLDEELIALLARSWGVAFSRAMAGARLALDDPSLVSACIEAIDRLEPEGGGAGYLGAAYESLLGQMQLSAHQGQFRTPVALRRLMIDLVDPRADETICDPAAGTGSLLVEAVAHMLEKGEEPRSDALRGFDISEGMARLGAINLLLHGIGEPQIAQRDTLAAGFDLTAETATVVVANPPFGDTFSRRSVHGSLTEVGRRTDLLFLEQCRNLLGNTGRAAVLVPQAALFGKTNDYVNVRRNWLTRGNVHAIVALPVGMLDQHSGVRTAIFFASASGQTERVHFFQLPESRGDPGSNDAAEIDMADVAAAVNSRVDGVDPPTPSAAALRTGSWSATFDEIKARNWSLLPSIYGSPEPIEPDDRDPLELLDQIEAGQAEIEQRLREARRLLEEA
jgi:type I restriction enzyme M protein